MHWVLAATLICGASVFTACSSNEDNHAMPDGNTPGIAMIVKNGQIDYWRQIETAFRGICQEKGMEAYYYATTSDNAYQEQASAVKELRKLGSEALKAIVFAPCYGVHDESTETEVAALAKERGIPVVILDSPVKADSPLYSCPYFGTDNAAAGKAMAEMVAADEVAVFAMAPGPGIERADAFKVLKPAATVYPIGDNAISEVQSALAEFDDFVFFNGSPLLDVLPMLKAAGKRVYTFDAYGDFLDELIAGSPCLRGVMAQNTFGMTRKSPMPSRARWCPRSTSTASTWTIPACSPSSTSTASKSPSSRDSARKCWASGFCRRSRAIHCRLMTRWCSPLPRITSSS